METESAVIRCDSCGKDLRFYPLYGQQKGRGWIACSDFDCDRYNKRYEIPTIANLVLLLEDSEFFKMYPSGNMPLTVEGVLGEISAKCTDAEGNQPTWLDNAVAAFKDGDVEKASRIARSVWTSIPREVL